MSWIALGVGVVTTGVGIYQKSRANKKAKKALSERKAYQTPDEIFQILNAVQSKAQGDTQTRDFQTQQIDNSFANQLGVAELLGADPNDLSSLFNQKMQGILQVGQQFHQSNMEMFGKYTGALEMVAANKAGEWKSTQDFVKDDLQAAAADGAAANQTINSGINMALSGYSASQSNKLYKDYLDGKGVSDSTKADYYDQLQGVGKYANTGFNNSTITGAVQSSPTQRTVGTGVQSIVQPATQSTGNYTNDAGFLQWLQQNGIGTKR